MQSDPNILQVNNLSKFFGGLAAVSNCSLKIKKGSITGIIGPNGSGKTTLFNLIAGNLESSKGTVLFNDEDITNVPSYELFSKGVLRTFQIAHEFTNLTVLENLMMVPGKQSGENLVNALFKSSLVKKEEAIVKKKALEVIDFLNLKHLSNELAGNLSGGQKKLLELGRTMMVDAKLVLLDEVGAGVNRTLLKDIGSAILRLNKEKGYTFRDETEKIMQDDDVKLMKDDKKVSKNKSRDALFMGLGDVIFPGMLVISSVTFLPEIGPAVFDFWPDSVAI